MKKIYIILNFILTCSFLIMIINSIYLSQYIKQDQKILLDEKFNKLINNQNLKYIFIGDSHTKFSVDENLINKSFNYGVTGESYMQEYYRIKKLIKNNTKTTFILEVDLHTFYFYNISQELEDDLFYYKDKIKSSEIRNILGYQYSPIKIFIKSNFKFIGKGEIAFEMILQKIINNFNIIKINKTKDFSLIKNKTKVVNEDLLVYFRNSKSFKKENFKFFLKIIKIIDESNLSIIFIKYPVTKDFFNEYKKINISDTNYYNYIFHNINKTIKNKYRILDYQKKFFNKDKYFKDSNHLNKLGKKKLSEILKKDLIIKVKS